MKCKYLINVVDYLLVWFGLWGLTPLSTIFRLYRVVRYILVEETEVPEENHRPVASD